MRTRSERTVSDQRSGRFFLPVILEGSASLKMNATILFSRIMQQVLGCLQIYSQNTIVICISIRICKRGWWCDPAPPFKGVTAIRASSTPTDFAGFCFKSHQTKIPHKTLLRKGNQKICWNVFASEQDKCVGRHVDKTQMFPSSKRKHNINSEALMSKIFKEKIRVKKLK